MKKVSGSQVVTPAEALERPLPAQIQEALGELVGVAREGLLALSVGVGLSVVHELMEAEVEEVVGPKGRHNPDRTAKRHGHERGSMTLGGRRVEVTRPRIRTVDDERELPVETYEHFADRDPLTVVVMNRMLAGVSTRRYAGVGEPVGEEVERESRSTGKSTVSELFIERTRTALEALMGRRLDDVRLAVMMIDGIEIADRTHVVALGISTDGVKIPLGLWEGSTENATLARSLLSDLVDRGLDPEQAILFVIDGGKPCAGRSRTCSASTRWCIGVTVTRREMSLTCFPSATARRSWPRSAARGRWRTRTSPRSGSSDSRPSSTAPGRTPPARCGRASRRR